LVQRAKKYAEKDAVHAVEQLFYKNAQFGLVINERMLHFPAQIAGPTLQALKLVLNQFSNSNFNF
jgi:hypothetical protein